MKLLSLELVVEALPQLMCDVSKKVLSKYSIMLASTK